VHSVSTAHATQAAPPAPHLPLAVPGWQTPDPSQQPFGQLVESQTQLPPTHSCPVAHAMQAAPPAPQSAFVAGFTQVVPLQQPVVQYVGSQYAAHAWLAHLLPPLHAAHAAPPVPQSALAVPGWQTPDASQQPCGQLVASHWHAPSTHSWPAGQATHAAPLAPHSASVAGFTQAVPLQHPDAQSVGPQYATQA
jgi:hypothetical protein